MGNMGAKRFFEVKREAKIYIRKIIRSEDFFTSTIEKSRFHNKKNVEGHRVIYVESSDLGVFICV